MHVSEDSEPTTVRDPHPRRRMVAVILAVTLAITGMSLLGYGLANQEMAPATSRAGQDVAGAPTSPAPDAAVPVAGGPMPAVARPAGLAPSLPTAISIPSIDVTSPVNSVGLNPDRTMQVPAPGPRYDQAAWYRYSVTPGQVGPSVLIGHIDSAANGPSVFFDLADLSPGDRIEVTRADGTTPDFRVDAVRSYAKDAFPTEIVYGGTTRPEIRLITCGGSFDADAGSYRNNTVVFAHLFPGTPPGRS